MNETDQALISTLATALLIKAGGHIELTPEEWTAAILHESTIWIGKNDREVVIALIDKEARRA